MHSFRKLFNIFEVFFELVYMRQSALHHSAHIKYIYCLDFIAWGKQTMNHEMYYD